MRHAGKEKCMTLTSLMSKEGNETTDEEGARNTVRGPTETEWKWREVNAGQLSGMQMFTERALRQLTTAQNVSRFTFRTGIPTGDAGRRILGRHTGANGDLDGEAAEYSGSGSPQCHRHLPAAGSSFSKQRATGGCSLRRVTAVGGGHRLTTKLRMPDAGACVRSSNSQARLERLVAPEQPLHARLASRWPCWQKST